MKQTQLNRIAHNVKKPAKPRPWGFKGATEYLNKNREGVAKLRKRGFAWSQIAEIFEKINVPVNYNNLYTWQRNTFQQRQKPIKVKVGDKIKINNTHNYTVVGIKDHKNILIQNKKGDIRRITTGRKFTKI
jgi:hypothetical protein